ncbi:MAG TPA: galactokinase family protein [Acidimicrobiales bacterium]|nr:galactokinase family protein [Acidimicrobiales bacterium]
MTEPTAPGSVPGASGVRAHSPGRVNLIGDHTDYNEGVALPLAIDLGTSVTFVPDTTLRVVLRAEGEPEPADVDVHVPLDPASLLAFEPRWARYVAAVVALVRPATGGRGVVQTTLPVGAGLSSSAALEVATALALGFEGQPLVLARTCQRAEHAATGVASGLMDQLVVSAARPGCATYIDFADCSVDHVAVPEGIDIVVVHSGERRTLDRSGYAARQAECEAAAYRLGPLGRIDPQSALALPDAVLRRRARHVVSECDRVKWMVAALRAGDLVEAGRLMTASHESLARDFEVSTPRLDELVGWLVTRPGVYGARLTGAGFGGCVVALTEPGAVDLTEPRTPAWRVRPAGGASVAAFPGPD